MQGTIIVLDLEPNRDYVLLRYNSYKQVPDSGDAEAGVSRWGVVGAVTSPQ
jgi:hypothetical protein